MLTNSKKEEKIMNLKNLKPNDLLVMPRFGVGKCKDWQAIEIYGCKAKMLSIYFYTSKVTVHFPKEKMDRVKARALASLAEIEKCFEILESPKPNLHQNWIATLKIYYQKLNSGDLQKLAELIRDTHIESKMLRDQNYTKSEINDTAIDLLAYELMLVQNISYEQAKNKIQLCFYKHIEEKPLSHKKLMLG
jgi:CarD family transcriptional regulator